MWQQYRRGERTSIPPAHLVRDQRRYGLGPSAHGQSGAEAARFRHHLFLQRRVLEPHLGGRRRARPLQETHPHHRPGQRLRLCEALE